MFKGTITYNTCGILIHPYTKNQCKTIEKWTSIYDKVYHKYIETTGFNNIEDKTFATHRMSKSSIQRMFPDYQIIEKKYNKYHKIQPFSMVNSFQLTDLQFDIINKIFDIGNDRNFINLQTGAGKTVICVKLIALYGIKPLIICYSTRILKQWYQTFIKLTDIDPKRILRIDASSILDAIYKNDYDTDRFDVYICTPKLFESYCKHNGWNRLDNIVTKMGIGMKIIDESHKQILSTVKIDAYTNIYKSFYLSADYNQVSHRKRQLYYNMFHNVPIIKPDEQILQEMKYITVVVVDYNSEPSPEEVLSVYSSSYGFSNYRFMQYQFSKDKILITLKNILGVIQNTNMENYKILILVSLIEHVDKIHSIFTDELSDKYRVGRYHGKVSDIEKENTCTNCDIIISTYMSFSTGIDDDKIRYVISLDQVDEITDNQSAGRARPKDGIDCYYFIFVDSGFNYCNKKINPRLNYLKGRKAKKIYKIKY